MSNLFSNFGKLKWTGPSASPPPSFTNQMQLLFKGEEGVVCTAEQCNWIRCRLKKFVTQPD